MCGTQGGHAGHDGISGLEELFIAPGKGYVTHKGRAAARQEDGMTTRDLKLPDQRHPEKAHRPDNAQPKKPDWIRVRAPTSEGYKQTRDILREKKLVTVCEEAGCRNGGGCWSGGRGILIIRG